MNMRFAANTVACLLLALLVSGCAGTVKHMREVPAGAEITSPAAGNALVVFMRSSGLGYAIQSSVFDIADNNPTLAGIVAAKAKVAYQVSPGKHLFMVIGENADFMSADLLPDKTYYALVTPRMGMWKARFSLKPILENELHSEDLNGWLNDCTWVEKTDESDLWAKDNMSSIESKRAQYYPEWLEKPETERPALRKEDGR